MWLVRLRRTPPWGGSRSRAARAPGGHGGPPSGGKAPPPGGCPRRASAELEAVIVNTAGGVAGGDRFTLGVTVEPEARLIVTTAAAEKGYRTPAPEARIDVTLDVAAGGSLSWLPQETILFDRARLKRSIDVDLAEDARLVLAGAVVFGRPRMGGVV